MGGGFCELHGPYDPPHRVCPYCAIDDKQRRAYGPPPEAVPAQPEDQEPVMNDAEPEDDFVHETVEPELPPDVTEVVPRPDQPDLGAYDGPRPFCWLVVKEPDTQRGELLHIRPNDVIGREADVKWPDPRLSRRHAQFTFEAVAPEAETDSPPVYTFHLWPFAPTNPVILNGEEVRAATPLHENDEIRLGDTLFVVKLLID